MTTVSIFEVYPSENLEDRFIYTVPTTDGNILPFSALTLNLVNVSSEAEFKPIGGKLSLRDPPEPDRPDVIIKKGFPYIAILNSGPTIVWDLGKINEPILDKYPLMIPKRFLVDPNTTQLEAVPIKSSPVYSSPRSSVPIYPQSYPPPESQIPPGSQTPSYSPLQGPSYRQPESQIPTYSPSQSVKIPQPQSLDQPGSPSSETSSIDLNDKVEFLTALVEAFLRREYKLYEGMTCPERLPLNGQSLPFVPVEQIDAMLRRGEIDRMEQNPLFQPFAGSPRTFNRILTFYNKQNTPFIVKATYNAQTKQIGPPN